MKLVYGFNARPPLRASVGRHLEYCAEFPTEPVDAFPMIVADGVANSDTCPFHEDCLLPCPIEAELQRRRNEMVTIINPNGVAIGRFPALTPEAKEAIYYSPPCSRVIQGDGTRISVEAIRAAMDGRG